MTGSISKALTAKAIINPEIVTSFQPKSNTHHFDKELDLDLLMVSFDGLGFISHGINLLDLRGRKLLLEIIREEIKSLLEVEYPFGNCIYEDENNLCFLIPPLMDESFNFVEREIQRIFNERTSGLLIPVIERSRKLKYYGEELISMKKDAEGKTRRNFMGNLDDFKPKWFEEWNEVENKDKCVLCGTMPQYEGKENDNLCAFCYNLRKDKSTDKTADSPWLDEIADENGKLAVVVGSFHPVDRWLSGEFLNYQYIRTLADITENTSLSFEDAAIRFVENFYDEMNKKGDFVAFLRTPIYALNKLSKEEKEILGGGSKVGEIYYRLSEANQTFLKGKYQLSREETNKIAQEVVEVTTKKPSSPSRLHRIWRELQIFSDRVIQCSRDKMPRGKRLKFELDNFEGEEGIYKAEIEGVGMIEVLHEGNGKFFAIERIDKHNPSDELENSCLKNHEHIIEKVKGNKNISVFEDRIKGGEFVATFEKEGEYRQFREILTSPNGFMFVLPAKRAFDVVRAIKEEFEREYSKALGKLSLNIGIVFSHRKSPIYVSLDAARRFREEFKLEDEEGFISVEKQHLCETSESTNGEHPYHYLTIPVRARGKEIFWKVEHTLGDGRIDRYHPYFVSSDGKLLHVNDITFKDKMKVYLSYFDFEYLDTTVRRFDIALGEDKKRAHPIVGSKGPRPYLLDELYTFERLREIVEAIGSWTPIRDVEALAASKREDWTQSVKFEDVRKEYEALVESLLENKLSHHFDRENWRGNIKAFLKRCIMEGSFFDALELFRSIMKLTIRGDKDE